MNLYLLLIAMLGGVMANLSREKRAPVPTETVDKSNSTKKVKPTINLQQAPRNMTKSRIIAPKITAVPGKKFGLNIPKRVPKSTSL